MVRKALHAAWKTGKEIFATTSHVRPLFHLTRRTFQYFGGHHSGGCGRQFSENRIKM